MIETSAATTSEAEALPPTLTESTDGNGSQFLSPPLVNPGIVYILSNPSMEGYFKIGKTQGNSPQDVITRMRQLDDTPVPLPFDCEYAAVVENYEQVERAMHIAFGENRVRPGREFFEGIPPFRVKAVLELLAKENVTPDGSETYDDAGSGRSSPIRRRPGFKISQARVPEGATLLWADDLEKQCTVTGNDRVVHEDQVYSLSQLTATFKGWRNKYAPHPAQYWLYEGQTLQERREQYEAEENGDE